MANVFAFLVLAQIPHSCEFDIGKPPIPFQNPRSHVEKDVKQENHQGVARFDSQFSEERN